MPVAFPLPPHPVLFRDQAGVLGIGSGAATIALYPRFCFAWARERAWLAPAASTTVTVDRLRQ